MAFEVTINGDQRISKILLNLSPKIEIAIDKTDGQFMKDVQKSAKLRAPRMTGDMADSIKANKGTEGWNLTMSSPYGRYQEGGFKGHLVNSNASTKNSLGTLSGTYGVPPGVTILIQGQKAKHFIRNALEKNLAKLQEKLSKATSVAIESA